jgi:hypothetical protein
LIYFLGSQKGFILLAFSCAPGTGALLEVKVLP